MRSCVLTILFLSLVPLLPAFAGAAPRYVIADQDASGPAGSDQRSLMMFVQSGDVRLLGITVVTGDGWLNEQVGHTLRMLESVGRTDIPVYAGSNVPLWRTQEWTRLMEPVFGKAGWMGAWRSDGSSNTATPHLIEGNPKTRVQIEDAAHFMIRAVHQFPHLVTIYAAGPLTNIALAVRLDPQFAELAQELVLMGGSLAPQTTEPEWANAPRHEFNFWFDPEAASIVLRAPWKKVTQTTIDASIATRVDPEVTSAIEKSLTPAAEYLRKYTRKPVAGVDQFAWDELAAATWFDPTVIKRQQYLYEDVNTEHGANYGDTLTWSDEIKPSLPLSKVHLVTEADLPKLQHLMIRLLTAPTPKATVQ